MSSGLITINPPSLLDLVVFTLSAPLAAAFYVVYGRLGRRRVDLIFANILLCTAVYAFAALMVDNAAAAFPALWWTRVLYVVGALGMVFIVHFVLEFIGERGPVANRIITALYILGVVVAATTCSPLFLDARTQPSGPRSWLNVAPWLPEPGPLQWVFVFFWVSLNGYALFKLYRHLRTSPQAAPGPLRYTQPLLIGFLILTVTGSLDILIASLTSICTFPLVLIGIMAVCLPAAVALGREVLDAEMEKQKLAEALRMRDEAVRDVAHELKGTLTPIGMAASLLLDRPERSANQDVQTDLLNVIVEECQRLTRLINNILDTARLEAGRPLELRLDRVNLRELVESVVETQRLRSDKHALMVQFSCRTETFVVDPDKVHQIVTNLVDNAIKYSPDGGHILVAVSEGNGDIAIHVSDEGIGMTPEQQAHLFQPFRRVIDPTRKITGTGIGLHLIKALVEAHGGRIWVESEYTRGSTFTFTLPKRNGSTLSDL